MVQRKSSRSGFDYATSLAYADPRYLQTGYNSYPYGTHYSAPGYPSTYAAAYNSAYGVDGYQYMRNYDPSYDAFYTEGPTVDEKWRNSYPYVPTSYHHHTSGFAQPDSRLRPVSLEMRTLPRPLSPKFQQVQLRLEQLHRQRLQQQSQFFKASPLTAEQPPSQENENPSTKDVNQPLAAEEPNNHVDNSQRPEVEERGSTLPRRAASAISGAPSTTSTALANGRPESTDSNSDEREHWGSQWEFIFSCIGLSVGIGNVWRFPYLAFQNGGGAFLIPYFILLLVVGKPLYLMECALGQFSQASPVAVWKMSPIGRGVGFAMCTISMIVAIYYNILMGYCFFYMFASFTSELPWEKCNPEWADLDSCYVRTENITSCKSEKCQSSTEQYWERYVLGLHKASVKTFIEKLNDTHDVNKTYAFAEFGSIGEIKWDLCLCVLLAWIIIFLCLCKGIKSSGKVVYFTATFPYLILIILLVRGLLLEGALDGVKFFFIPKWEKLMDITVWRKAAEQMFFSLSVSWGGLIMFGSYNKFRNPVHHQAFAISLLDFATSIIAGVVVFSILGELKRQLNVDNIEDVVRSGQGLAFIAYPEAVSLLAVPPLWSFLFFFMLFLLGLDSEFALMETVLSGIYDIVPKLRHHKAKVTLALSSCLFLLSIPCVSYSGQYVFDIMDTYGGGLGVLWLAIFETIVISWIYGVRRFADDMGFMLNTKINIYWKICWAIIPIILIVIFGIAIYFWKEPDYGNGSVFYPKWAHGIGWFLTLVVALQVPVGALIVLLYYSVKKRPLDAFRPTSDWGPGDRKGMVEWIEYKQTKALTCKQHPFSTYPFAYENPGMYYSNSYLNNSGNYHM